MSVIPLKADIHQRGLHVRLVPTADIGDCWGTDPLTGTNTTNGVVPLR